MRKRLGVLVLVPLIVTACASHSNRAAVASPSSSPPTSSAPSVQPSPSPTLSSSQRTAPPSPSSHGAAPPSPRVIDGFAARGSMANSGVSLATLQAMGHLLSAPSWTLSVPNYAGQILATVPGWSRSGSIGAPFATVYTLTGSWGSLPLHTDSVEVGQTTNLAPDVIWFFEAVAPFNAGALSTAQAAAGAQVLVAQMSSVATQVWSQGQSVISLSAAAALPAVTVAVSNGTNVLAVTVNDGTTTWQVNNTTFGVLPDVAPSTVVNWIKETL